MGEEVVDVVDDVEAVLLLFVIGERVLAGAVGVVATAVFVAVAGGLVGLGLWRGGGEGVLVDGGGEGFGGVVAGGVVAFVGGVGGVDFEDGGFGGHGVWGGEVRVGR